MTQHPRGEMDEIPEDVPSDIWQDAAYAVTAAPEYTKHLHETVARAIMAERERSAQVAERWHDKGIAAAIRIGPTP